MLGVLENVMYNGEGKQYICVDIMKLLKGKVNKVCSLLVKPNSRMIDIGELYEKTNNVVLDMHTLSCIGHKLIKTRSKKEFEKILRAIVEYDEWSSIIPGRVNGDLAWEVVIVKDKTYEKIVEIIGGEKNARNI